MYEDISTRFSELLAMPDTDVWTELGETASFNLTRAQAHERILVEEFGDAYFAAWRSWCLG